MTGAEPVETLVERVRSELSRLRNIEDPTRPAVWRSPVGSADLALTELAERLRIAEANHPDAMAGIAALRGRLEAAERERDEWRHEAESRMEIEQNAPAAEARVAALEEALRELDANGHEWFVNDDGSEGKHLDPCPGCLARAALRVEGDAADSPKKRVKDASARLRELGKSYPNRLEEKK